VENRAVEKSASKPKRVLCEFAFLSSFSVHQMLKKGIILAGANEKKSRCSKYTLS